MSGFTSNLRGMTIIDDTNASQFTRQIEDPNEPFAGGYVPRDYDRDGLSSPYTGPNIPESEWAGRIKEKEERRASLMDLFDDVKMPVLNQGRLPYCWAYGTVGAMMMSYAQQGTYVPHLSATSVAAKVKGYREVGGWAKECLQGVEKWGVATLKHWPEAKNDRRLDTHEMQLNAAQHKVSKPGGFEELRSQDFNSLASALLSDFPVTLGLMWWGHLVYAGRLVLIERGSYGVEIVNSWGQRWENGGRAILRREKAIAHEQVVIKNVTPVMA